MTLAPSEFIRRFMLHVLPNGFHRIRHYGLLASCRTKAATLARARELIAHNTGGEDAVQRRSCRIDGATDASLPVLRCSHGDHRDVRGGLRAAPPTDHQAAPDQDRHVMMPIMGRAPRIRRS
jgi:hypothetical protein